MGKILQALLLILAVLAVLGVGGELAYSVIATTHGSTPARVVQTQAGPYALTVKFYTYPANASYALPFSIAPTQPVAGSLSYQVTTTPDQGDVPATPVRASLSSDPHVANGVQGTGEVTVQGNWTLDITVSGPSGTYTTDVPLVATAPPAIPLWFGWLIGGLPLYGLLAFFVVMYRKRTRKIETPVVEPVESIA